MIDLDISGDVARVTLNAPAKLNSLDEQALRDLGAAYDEAERAGVRALVLRGEGRAFCAGRDISGVDPRDDDVMGYLGGLVTPLLRRMSAFPAPTFAASVARPPARLKAPKALPLRWAGAASATIAARIP